MDAGARLISEPPSITFCTLMANREYPTGKRVWIWADMELANEARSYLHALFRVRLAILRFFNSSARSARQHKAWGVASEASKPQDHNPKVFQPAERATDLGVSAPPLWIDPIIQRLSPAPRVPAVLWIAILGLTPQAL